MITEKINKKISSKSRLHCPYFSKRL